MDKPRVVLCTATWARGKQTEWWEWVWDEEKREYIKDGNLMSMRDLMFASAQMQSQGWQLCRTVV